MSPLKQENDSPLQLNTESAPFTLAFTFFSNCSLVHDSKLSLLYVLWFENISHLLKQKVAGKKFCATFYEFKAYLFVESLITSIDNFLKNKNR